LIIREAKGNPRLTNILCDNALVTGLGYKRKPITGAIAKEVIADFNGTTRQSYWKWIPITAGIGMCTVLLGWVMLTDIEGSWANGPITRVKGLIIQGIEIAKAKASSDEAVSKADIPHASEQQADPSQVK
jgi:hypothetical protein